LDQDIVECRHAVMLDQDIVECKQVVMLDIAFALTGA